jgi:hypothetical protein
LAFMLVFLGFWDIIGDSVGKWLGGWVTIDGGFGF